MTRLTPKRIHIDEVHQIRRPDKYACLQRMETEKIYLDEIADYEYCKRTLEQSNKICYLTFGPAACPTVLDCEQGHLHPACLSWILEGFERVSRKSISFNYRKRS
jgi:hypothetical protein